MKNKYLLMKLFSSPKIKSLGVKKEVVFHILKEYNDIAMRHLLENGHIELENGMIIEIVQLLDRVHVLRGTTYKNNRKYKLKLTMEESLYNKIEDYYEQLKEDIK